MHLAFILMNACEYGRDAMAHCGVVHGKFHREAVRAVDDDIVTGHQRLEQRFVRRLHMGMQAERWVQRTQTLCQQQRFRLPAVRRGIGHLPVEVRRFEDVGVDQCERADTRAGKVSGHRDAKATTADDQHARGAELRLAGSAHFR